MKFINTNGNEMVSFREALLRGGAANHGLYTIDQESIPRWAPDKIRGLSKEYYQIAEEVLWPFLAEEMPWNDFADILKDAYDQNVIPVPIQRVTGRSYLLRLDQGPTASFKDFAARFFARMLNYFAGRLGVKLIVVVATSGDTGPAIADALFGMKNIAVVVLYPGSNIYEGQRKQITTLQGNVYAVEVADGDFNLCQDLAIRLMADKDFGRGFFGNEDIFTSANSISLGRLLPQIVFPFYAYSQLASSGEEMIISIPSGNFGDMTGSVIAKKMGLPIKKIIVAVNENDEFARFMDTGKYEIMPTEQTSSSAMDVNNPNNLPRLFQLYGGKMVNLPEHKGKIEAMPDLDAMRRDLCAISVSDAKTIEAIKEVFSAYDIVLDPHGAVGWSALNSFLGRDHNRLAVVWETASPSKFPEIIEETIGITPPLTETMSRQADMVERRFYLGAKADRDGAGNLSHSSAQYAELKQIVAGQIKL